MKNPRSIFIRDSIKEGEAELVKFAGFIVHVDTSNDKRTRVCFKEDTSDRDSKLISVDAWHRDKGPDWRKLLENVKGRFAVVIATKTVNGEYDNYSLESIDMAPVPKN